MRPVSLLPAGRKRSKRIGVWKVSLLLGEWNRRVAGVHAIARILDLTDRSPVAGVHDFHAAHFLVRLPGLLQEFPFSGIHLVLVDIAQSAHDFVLSAGGVSGSLEIDKIATREFCRCRRLEAAGYEVRVRQNLFADKSSTIQVGIRGRLHALGGETIRSRRSSLRSLCGAAIGA